MINIRPVSDLRNKFTDIEKTVGYNELILHVAEWNRSAVQMYKNEGFVIVKTDIISV